MALLDMQGMSQTRWGGMSGGNGGGSTLSLALCDSTASVTLCV
jgi:Lanthionine-containing peptide SapB precursor RamS